MTNQATVIKDSINPKGIRIRTVEVEYPRMVHSELMTHRVFSRNAASSRAIPVSKMIELVESNPAMPSHWGKNQPGMQADYELDELGKAQAKSLWLEASRQAVSIAKVMNDSGLHKQVINRILEPYQHIKVVITSTEWENFFWLRKHKDADPTIKELAEKVYKAFEESNPVELQYGEWHLPYVNDIHSMTGQYFCDQNGTEINLETAKMLSASLCAQVSYRLSNTSTDKAKDIYAKLIESEPCHSSPVEHSAMCMDDTGALDSFLSDTSVGVTHIDRKDQWWSGNFRGWVQNRQTIPNNAKYG